MTRANLRYDEYCEYCTEVMKHCDPNWKINCIETAHHILCTCPMPIFQQPKKRHIQCIPAQNIKNSQNSKTH